MESLPSGGIQIKKEGAATQGNESRGGERDSPGAHRRTG